MYLSSGFGDLSDLEITNIRNAVELTDDGQLPISRTLVLHSILAAISWVTCLIWKIPSLAI